VRLADASYESSHTSDPRFRLGGRRRRLRRASKALEFRANTFDARIDDPCRGSCAKNIVQLVQSNDSRLSSNARASKKRKTPNLIEKIDDRERMNRFRAVALGVARDGADPRMKDEARGLKIVVRIQRVRMRRESSETGPERIVVLWIQEGVRAESERTCVWFQIELEHFLESANGSSMVSTTAVRLNHRGVHDDVRWETLGFHLREYLFCAIHVAATRIRLHQRTVRDRVRFDTFRVHLLGFPLRTTHVAATHISSRNTHLYVLSRRTHSSRHNFKIFLRLNNERARRISPVWMYCVLYL